MSKTTAGLFVGLILGIVAYFGSFLAFLIVVLFGAAGLVCGLILDGRIDVRALLGSATTRR